jgi:hypothetical protein
MEVRSRKNGVAKCRTLRSSRTEAVGGRPAVGGPAARFFCLAITSETSIGLCLFMRKSDKTRDRFCFRNTFLPWMLNHSVLNKL